MSVKLLYFAGLREALVCSEETLPALPEGVRTLGALRNWLCLRGDAWLVLAAGKSVRAAVNQDLAQADTPISDGDEIAFFRLLREADMPVSVQFEDFDAGIELKALGGQSETGALASFVGLVRGGDDLIAMILEHYPGMTEKSLNAIAEEACGRWPLQGVRIIHRVGRLLPGQQIVFVGVASSHRAAAFEACEFVMDFLKTRAPFWKKEERASGSAWVDARETDDQAAARW